MNKNNDLKAFSPLSSSLLPFLQMLSWASAAGSLTNVKKSANLSWLLAALAERLEEMRGCLRCGRRSSRAMAERSWDSAWPPDSSQGPFLPPGSILPRGWIKVTLEEESSSISSSSPCQHPPDKFSPPLKLVGFPPAHLVQQKDSCPQVSECTSDGPT